MEVRIKRVYETPASDDGKRILVDRLWPRGMTKEKARVDLWLKEIGPSTDLRKWFGHESEKWVTFRRRYLKELKEKGDLLEIIKKEAHQVTVTLLYAARDEKHNEAIILQQFLGSLP